MRLMQTKRCNVEKIREMVTVNKIAQGVFVFDEHMCGTKVFLTAL